MPHYDTRLTTPPKSDISTSSRLRPEHEAAVKVCPSLHASRGHVFGRISTNAGTLQSRLF